MKVVIIDNYDSFTFNLYQMLQVMVGEKIRVFRNDEIDLEALHELKPDKIVLSPGPGHPENPEDFGVCKDIILQNEKRKLPVLGVCLGHQGICHYFGGKVTRAPQIVHGKTSKVKVTKSSPLLADISQTFEAMRYHSLIASDEGFPQELEVTGREVEHNLIMALQHKRLPIYGVQFHPESIGTPEGQQILRNFIEKCR
jgi:anthranilate synthase/aminodeoxychorismate synthase-like glutamine amidotransferase